MAAASLARLFELRTLKIEEAQIAYAIVVLDCRNDVIYLPHFGAIGPYDDGQGWPDVQRLPHWCSGSTVKSQIQAAWTNDTW